MLPSDVDSQSPQWDMEVELLVAGAGPAGMTAALVASQVGLDAIICEKTEFVGGTAAYSAGALWVPGNSRGAAAGHGDSLDAAQTYLNAVIRSNSRQHLRQAFLESGPRAIDCLNACGIGLADAGSLRHSTDACSAMISNACGRLFTSLRCSAG
jgi:3-oxosteroid 1-dehydrogenase